MHSKFRHTRPCTICTSGIDDVWNSSTLQRCSESQHWASHLVTSCRGCAGCQPHSAAGRGGYSWLTPAGLPARSSPPLCSPSALPPGGQSCLAACGSALKPARAVCMWPPPCAVMVPGAIKLFVLDAQRLAMACMQKSSSVKAPLRAHQPPPPCKGTAPKLGQVPTSGLAGQAAASQTPGQGPWKRPGPALSCLPQHMTQMPCKRQHTACTGQRAAPLSLLPPSRLKGSDTENYAGNIKCDVSKECCVHI